MSLDSWKEEFYEEKFVKERAAQQSLKKWKGLLPENLAKHGVRYDPTFKVVRYNIEFIRINDSSCSLCYFYYRVNPDAPSCVECPLYTVNGSVRCDKQNCRGVNLYVENNPIHMIEALERAVELEKQCFHNRRTSMCMDYPKSILDEEKEAYKVMRKVKDGYGTIFVSTDINKIYKKNELYISHPIGSTYYSSLTAHKFFHAFEDKATAKVALESFTEILKWNVVIDNKENFVIVKVKLKGNLHSGVVWVYSWGVLAGNEMTIIEEVN